MIRLSLSTVIWSYLADGIVRRQSPAGTGQRLSMNGRSCWGHLYGSRARSHRILRTEDLRRAAYLPLIVARNVGLAASWMVGVRCTRARLKWIDLNY